MGSVQDDVEVGVAVGLGGGHWWSGAQPGLATGL